MYSLIRAAMVMMSLFSKRTLTQTLFQGIYPKDTILRQSPMFVHVPCCLIHDIQDKKPN